MDSLQSDLKTRNASFWRMWENGSDPSMPPRSSSPLGAMLGVEAVLAVFVEPREGAADTGVLTESGVLAASPGLEQKAL